LPIERGGKRALYARHWATSRSNRRKVGEIHKVPDDAMDKLPPSAHGAMVDRSADVRCPVCQGPDLSPKPHNLSFCGDCRHVFQCDLRVSMVYDADYAHQYDNRPHQEMSRLRWDFIQQHLDLPPGSRVLDIGYGNGAFLKHARRAGMEIYGIDLHGEDFGIPEVSYSTPVEYDLVCFFDSIEHFPHFDEILGLDTRHVVASVPDPPVLLLSQPRSWRHYKPGEHLHYFSRDSLDLLIHRWGLRYKIANGHPEDAIRGKLSIDGRNYDNIYTAIYGRDPRPATRR
jgi:SAM-dependent methyltransferase